MIRHIFLWNVVKGADPEEVVQILNELPRVIPGTRGWSIGKHEGAPGASGDLWDYGLTTDFDSFEDLERYSNHPAHTKAVERLLPMFAARAVCDYVLAPEGEAS
ncbi:Dabb family protein [Caballeronia sp. LjRoot34]|uniref:Dabb family protein n=1 Tax=Caballeronia sp. LjRoot34 TaxID=3342325 RepID=UPI003ECE5107